MSISQLACCLSQSPDQEVMLVGPSISWLSGNWSVRSVGQLDSRSGWLIVSWSASLFGDALDGWSAVLFRVTANKPDQLTRVGRSLGSPYLSDAALQAQTPRPFGLIVVVSPLLWRPYKFLIVVLMPPPHTLSTQSSLRFLPPAWQSLLWLCRPLFVLIAVVVVLKRSDISKIGRLLFGHAAINPIDASPLGTDGTSLRHRCHRLCGHCYCRHHRQNHPPSLAGMHPPTGWLLCQKMRSLLSLQLGSLLL